MGYCVIDDIKKVFPEERLIELTDDNNTGAYDENIMNSLIEKATNEINGYCQERYSIPFAVVPGLIKDMCVDIVIYLLYLRRERVPEEIQANYKRILEKLRDIADGKISLGTTDISEDGISFTNKTEDDRYFKDPEGYL